MTFVKLATATVIKLGLIITKLLLETWGFAGLDNLSLDWLAFTLEFLGMISIEVRL